MKCLVFGLGSMGKRRIRNLMAHGVRDIIGFDLNPKRAEEVSNEFKISVCLNLEQAFNQNSSVAIISTPPNKHMELARMAAERNMHIFTEAGTCLNGMNELISILKSKNSVGVPSCTLRFHPSIQKIRECIINRTIGGPLSFTYHCGQYLPDWHPWEDYRTFYASKRETGACREIVPFELNWLTWIFGWPSRTSGFKAKVSALECDIDDVYQIILDFNQELLGHIQVDAIARSPIRYLRIIGSEGTIEWNMTEQILRIYDTKLKKWSYNQEIQHEVVTGYSKMSIEQMYINEIGAFLDAISQRGVYPHSFEDDMKILKLLNAIEKQDLEEISYV